MTAYTPRRSHRPQAVRRLHVVTAEDIAAEDCRARMFHGLISLITLAGPFVLLAIGIWLVHPHMAAIVEAMP